jgi:hypothetical protein
MNKAIVIICTLVGAVLGLLGVLEIGGLVGGAMTGAVAGIPVYMTVGAIRNVIQIMRE